MRRLYLHAANEFILNPIGWRKILTNTTLILTFSIHRLYTILRLGKNLKLVRTVFMFFTVSLK